jgi:LmbE family N-acetylglucosaminyl deacetylase
VRRLTLVSFHAHPDDEALLTGGTLARAAAEGHRVVLVVATAGEAGLTSTAINSAGTLRARRLDELRVSAAALGVARVECFGFSDSGWKDSATGDPEAFSALNLTEAASPLVDVLREERADVLTTYDPVGGYGHPDHRQVHAAGAAAAHQAGTPRVLEATIDRDLLRRIVRPASFIPGLLSDADARGFAFAYAPRSEITHRVNVRPYLGAKRAAMIAHASQAAADEGTRTLQLLLRLPPWLFARIVGREWFIDRSTTPGTRDDIFAGLL